MFAFCAGTLLVLGVCTPAVACEPIVPFMQVVAPAVALTQSLAVLTIVVLAKSALFAFFEKRLPRQRAAVCMFLGNILTTLVGVLAAGMLGSGALWIVGVPLVFLLCWLPARRLPNVAPRPWMARRSPAAIAGLMTATLVGSCVLFLVGQGLILAKNLAAYWAIKLVAVYLALLASIALTTIWEEWAIWRLASRPGATAFFGAVLRTNVYVLLAVMAVAAAMMLPKRLASPDFLVSPGNPVVAAREVSPN